MPAFQFEKRQATIHVLKIYNSQEHKCALNTLFWFADLSRKQSTRESCEIANGNHFGRSFRVFYHTDN